MSCKASPSELIDNMTSLCSDTVFLPNFKVARIFFFYTKKVTTSKFDRMSVTSAITLNLRTKRLLPLTKYLPKHVRKGSTRGRAHRAYHGLVIAVPMFTGA
jgi:hypothetical protein